MSLPRLPCTKVSHIKSSTSDNHSIQFREREKRRRTSFFQRRKRRRGGEKEEKSKLKRNNLQCIAQPKVKLQTLCPSANNRQSLKGVLIESIGLPNPTHGTPLYHPDLTCPIRCSSSARALFGRLWITEVIFIPGGPASLYSFFFFSFFPPFFFVSFWNSPAKKLGPFCCPCVWVKVEIDERARVWGCDSLWKAVWQCHNRHNGARN